MTKGSVSPLAPRNHPYRNTAGDRCYQSRIKASPRCCAPQYGRRRDGFAIQLADHGVEFVEVTPPGLASVGRPEQRNVTGKAPDGSTDRQPVGVRLIRLRRESA